MKSAFIAVIAAGWLAHAAAQSAGPDSRWLPLSVDDTLEFYVDTKRALDRSKEVRKVWTMWSHPDRRDAMPLGGAPGSTFRSAIALIYVNCREWVHANAYLAVYSDAFGRGEMVASGGSTTPPNVAAYQDPVPGTNGEMLLEWACGKGRR